MTATFSGVLTGLDSGFGALLDGAGAFGEMLRIGDIERQGSFGVVPMAVSNG